jgi:putative transposase
MRYAFIGEHEARHQVKRMRRVLHVSSSGYYAWRARPQSTHDRVDRALVELIKEVFEAERKRYGSPRIGARLQRMGHLIPPLKTGSCSRMVLS